MASTIIVVVFFVFLFALITYSIFKEDVKSGMEMLTRLSAVFGVLIGAIPSYYFVNQAKTSEVDGANAQTVAAVEQKKAAVESISSKVDVLNEGLVKSVSTILASSEKTGKIDESDRAILNTQLNKAKEQISEIKVLEEKVKEDVSIKAVDSPSPTPSPPVKTPTPVANTNSNPADAQKSDSVNTK